MLGAGGDTSAASALWVLTELLRHPSVMKTLQGELDSIVGPNRLVQDDDLPNLPYLNAVLKETFRLHPVIPFLIPHESSQDCEIEGFHIPAKTRLFVNVWGIQRDPAVWEKPLEFNPNRFLNSTKDIRGQDFDLLPFGTGRRMCPGLNLGFLMVIYPVALLVHAIDWSLPEGQKPEDIDISEAFGIVLHKEQPLRVFGKGRLPDHVLYPAQDVSKQ
jgi:cytochrome P450